MNQNFDNLVLLYINELALDVFKNSGYSTYRNYCVSLRTHLKNKNINNNVLAFYRHVKSNLIKIFGIDDDEEVLNYINKFLEIEDDNFTILQKYVIKIKKHFPTSFN